MMYLAPSQAFTDGQTFSPAQPKMMLFAPPLEVGRLAHNNY